MAELTRHTARLLAGMLDCAPEHVNRIALAQTKWIELWATSGMGRKTMADVERWMLDGGYVYTRSKGWVRIVEASDAETLQKRLADLIEERKEAERVLADINEEIAYVTSQAGGAVRTT